MKTLDLLEAAALLKCHPDTLRKLAKRGEVPAAKIGRGWLFVEEQLQSWLLAKTEKNRER